MIIIVMIITIIISNIFRRITLLDSKHSMCLLSELQSDGVDLSLWPRKATFPEVLSPELKLERRERAVSI